MPKFSDGLMSLNNPDKPLGKLDTIAAAVDTTSNGTVVKPNVGTWSVA